MGDSLLKDIKINIRSILLPEQVGLSLRKFCESYQKHFGEPLPFQKLGFSSKEEFLKSINYEVIEFNWSPIHHDYHLRGIPDKKTQHIDKLVQNQKPPPRKFQYKNLNYQRSKGPRFSKMSASKNILQEDDVNNWLEKTTKNQMLATPKFNEKTVELIPPDYEEEMENDEENMDEDIYLYSKISESLKEKFREILSRHPRGIFLKDFECSFKAFYGKNLNLSEIGYFDLLDIVNDLPEIFSKVQSNTESDWLLFDARTKEKKRDEAFTPSPKKVIEKKFSSENLENAIIAVRRLLQAQDKYCIYIDSFEFIYNYNCELPFKVEELGFKDLTDFFDAIKDKVPLKFDYSNVRTKICLKYDPVSHSSPGASNLPIDVIPPSESFCVQELPVMEEDKYFPIYIGTIIDPGHLYIQLKGKTTSGSLKKLSEELEFYNTPAAEKYIMQPDDIILNAPCVSLFKIDQKWYRTKIIHIEEYNVHVEYIDYGNVEEVSKKNLRYLRESYFRFPAQAILARLAYIDLPPNADQWDPKTYNMLSSLCSDKVLMCRVVPSKRYTYMTSVHIMDTRAPEEIDISVSLVKANLAVNCEETETENTSEYLKNPDYIQNQERSSPTNVSPSPRIVQQAFMKIKENISQMQNFHNQNPSQVQQCPNQNFSQTNQFPNQNSMQVNQFHNQNSLQMNQFPNQNSIQVNQFHNQNSRQMNQFPNQNFYQAQNSQLLPNFNQQPFTLPNSTKLMVQHQPAMMWQNHPYIFTSIPPRKFHPPNVANPNFHLPNVVNPNFRPLKVTNPNFHPNVPNPNFHPNVSNLNFHPNVPNPNFNRFHFPNPNFRPPNVSNLNLYTSPNLQLNSLPHVDPYRSPASSPVQILNTPISDKQKSNHVPQNPMRATPTFVSNAFNPPDTVPPTINNNTSSLTSNLDFTETAPERNSNNIHPSTRNDSSNNPTPSEENQSELFPDEDDDETFNEICQEYGIVQRYVQRIYLKDSYKIHIVLLENKPYVPGCDILKLFWPNEKRPVLQRRLRQYDIFVNCFVISQKKYSDVFKQLQCFNVKGTQNGEGEFIALYSLFDVPIILNEFGHSSRFIRANIKHVIQAFDPVSPYWRSFEMPVKDEDINNDTDVYKFNRLCLYDLNAVHEGLKFKRQKTAKILSNYNTDFSTKHRRNMFVLISLYDAEIEKYHKRIQEIQSMYY